MATKPSLKLTITLEDNKYDMELPELDPFDYRQIKRATDMLAEQLSIMLIEAGLMAKPKELVLKLDENNTEEIK